jgi:hypothetical protein
MAEPVDTAEAAQRVIARIVERIERPLDACPLCHTFSGFALSQGVLYFVIVPFGQPPPPLPAGRAQPVVSLVCQKCGYQMFFNLATLGLTDLTGLIYQHATPTVAPAPTPVSEPTSVPAAGAS